MIEKTGGRSATIAPAESTPHAPHAALLVDFDNVTMGIRSDLQTQLRKLLNSDIFRGKVSVQRAYADWRRYPQYIVPLTEASIDLIFAPAVGANKKNATDIRLAIDALELVFTRPEIGTYILLSGDSDFSALVLKLKEYGKFVIGVGIRESSSDLLVQNCDEYYSYNELTGLAKTAEAEIVRHDPWELVVEAVQTMMRNGDVMRSDRLKQVMQSIDPNFDEKDVGCNRFSKFVLEAEKRGLLRLTKMENGQHAVDIGPNANVQVEQAAPAGSKHDKDETSSSGFQRRARTTRSKSEREVKERTLTLSESLELLKRALVAAGAVGDEATLADRTRERMIEIHGNESDPIFETKRFQRMLRQAHDADVIELIKSGGEEYMLKLSSAEAAEQAAVEATVDDAEEKPKAKRTAKKKSVTARKSTRSRARTVSKETPDEEEESKSTTQRKKTTAKKKTAKKKTVKKTTAKKATGTRAKKMQDETEDEAGTDAAPVAEKATKKKVTRFRTKKTKEADLETDASEKTVPETKPDAPAPKVHPRFRTGSRTPSAKPPVAEEEAAPDAKAADLAVPTPKPSAGPRTLGVRSGSRGAKRPVTEPEVPKPPKEESKPVEKAPKPQTESKPVQKAPKPKTESKAAEKTPSEKAPIPKAEPPVEPEEDGSGLFRKVTAAFQRAMGAGKEDAE